MFDHTMSYWIWSFTLDWAHRKKRNLAFFRCEIKSILHFTGLFNKTFKCQWTIKFKIFLIFIGICNIIPRYSFFLLRRGLTPPHRVKSISMAKFTSDELDFIRTHGNNECTKTWLGLWDPKRTIKQDHREFMIDKYERKRWHKETTNSY